MSEPGGPHDVRFVGARPAYKLAELRYVLSRWLLVVTCLVILCLLMAWYQLEAHACQIVLMKGQGPVTHTGEPRAVNINAWLFAHVCADANSLCCR